MADYTLSVKLTGDVKQMEKEFANAIRSVDTLKGKINSTTGQGSTFNQKLNAMGSQLDATGMKMMKFGGKATLGITTPLALAKKQMISAASDFEENINKVEVAFGDYANTVKDWSKTTTKQFGISRNAALEMTALFGDMGTSMGLTRQDASKMSMSLTGLAGDLASFKNVNIDVAQTALKGIFTGETESLKNLGIVMTQANLQNYALSKGITKKVEAMTEAEKVQLRYNYVMDSAKNAQGDYARTSDGAANSIRTFQATMENLAQVLGAVLLPSFTEIIQTATAVVQKFAELDPSTQRLIVKFALLAAAIGPVTTVLGAVTTTIGKTVSAISKIPGAVSRARDGFTTLRIHGLYAGDSMKAVATSMKTSAIAMGSGIKKMALSAASSMRVLAVSIWTAVAPILPMIIAIGLLVGAFVYLFKTNEEFRNSMLESWEEIKAAFVPLVDALKTLFENVMSAIMPAIQALGQAFSGILTAIMPIITGIAKVFAGIVVVIAKVISKVAPIISIFAMVFAKVGEAIASVATPAVNILSGVLNAIVGFLTSYVIPVITSVITTVINVITKIVQVVTPIVTFIASVIGKIILIISGIVSVIGGVFGAVRDVVMTIWNGITSFIGGAINSIIAIASAMISPFTVIFNAIKSVVVGVVDGIKSAWSGLKGFFGNLFSAIVAIVKAPINAIISGINFFIRGLNKIKIPDWVPGIGGKGIHISEIPHLARGTDNWQGGFARMNEGGRGELTYLPNGSVVVPHDISRTYAKESARLNSTSTGFDVSGLGDYIVTAITSQGTRLAEGIERGISGITMVADRREIGRMVSDLGFERR